MKLVIGFMTSILFCRTCYDSLKCNGEIDCPWLSPHDEANCSQQCLSIGYGSIPCECNKPRNMTCTGGGHVCYTKFRKLLVLFIFVNNHKFWKRRNYCRIN